MKYLFTLLSVFCIVSSCGNSSSSGESQNTDTIRATSKASEEVKPLAIISSVKIGGQEWMTEDIKTTVYNNGDPIFEAKNERKWVEHGAKKVGCYRILKNGTYVYNGYAVNDERGIIPLGFILPSESQFKRLRAKLGGGDSGSGKATLSMASYSIILQDMVEGEEGEDFVDVEIKSNGRSGFNAKRGGFVYKEGGLGNEGNCSYWWTSSTQGKSAYVVDIGYCSQDIGGGEGNFPFTYGFAVRALKAM